MMAVQSFLTAMIAVALFAVPAFAKFQIADIQKFPGYIEVTYDQDIAPRATDTLFVIDDSGSMYQHQINLSTFTEKMVETFVNNPAQDMQIGVITTSTDILPGTNPGHLVSIGGPAIVSRSTPNAAQVLKANLLVGTSGSGFESPFKALQLAISPELRAGPNAGFFRQGANLKVILFTDAEDQSQIAPTAIFNELTNLQSEMSTIGVLSIDAFIANTANACEKDEVRVEPDLISSLVGMAKGKAYPICAADMGPALNSIMTSPTTTAIEIPLPMAPVTSTLQVSYGSQILQGGLVQQGWVFDEGRQVIMIGNRVPWTTQPEGTRLKVRFTPIDWK